MTPIPLAAAAIRAVGAAAPVPAVEHALARIAKDFLGLTGIGIGLALLGFSPVAARHGTRTAIRTALRLTIALPVSWLPLDIVHAATGWPSLSLGVGLWLLLVVAMLALGSFLLPQPLRRIWDVGFAPPDADSHGSAAFAAARDTSRHIKPAAPADAFALGRLGRRRFYQDGHMLTCAPTGAGKGIGAVIPNLLDYPGSAFVLDLKGENYAVTARARRALGQDVFVVDPYRVTGAAPHALNWLDTLDPDDPDVVGRAATLADMLVVRSGVESEPHWNDTARDLLRGFLVYLAGLPPTRRHMAELRALLTLPEEPFAALLAEMLAAPARGGQQLVSRAAATHLGRPERERGSVLSTAQRHTAWLDDPRLGAALARSDFAFADLKRRPMTVYLAIPPDRLRGALGFVRAFIGLALDAMTATPGRPQHRVAFLLDEFGQLGRLDSLLDGLTLMRGYGAQLWFFVQDLSQLKAVYPRWQSFLANTTQQYFGTADYDTARTISNTLGQTTVAFSTRSRSRSLEALFAPARVTVGSGEHRTARPLLTPDEILRLGTTRALVLLAGEPPYLLDRLDYRSDPAAAARADPNPMHFPATAQSSESP